MVQAPGFFTLAGQEVLMLWSRSVAVMVSRSSAASMRKFERIGMVVLRSTTLCVAVSSRSRSARLTVISMAPLVTTGFSCSTSKPGISHRLLCQIATLYTTGCPKAQACSYGQNLCGFHSSDKTRRVCCGKLVDPVEDRNGPEIIGISRKMRLLPVLLLVLIELSSRSSSA